MPESNSTGKTGKTEEKWYAHLGLPIEVFLDPDKPLTWRVYDYLCVYADTVYGIENRTLDGETMVLAVRGWESRMPASHYLTAWAQDAPKGE